jgi:hypothetical protein
MTPEQATELWTKHGELAWKKCIPHVREILNSLPLSDDIPPEQALAIVQIASVAAVRAYRLGFKIGAAVSERETKKVKIITNLN